MQDRVTIMIGIPGSGKSTWVAANRPDATVCSADHFHTDKDGAYSWKLENQGRAHRECLRDFMAALDAAEPEIVVDNTNTTLDQIAPYIALADAYGVFTEVIAMTSRHVDLCIAENVHSVPQRTIQHMLRAQTRLLFYWPPRWPTVKYDDEI